MPWVRALWPSVSDGAFRNAQVSLILAFFSLLSPSAHPIGGSVLGGGHLCVRLWARRGRLSSSCLSIATVEIVKAVTQVNDCGLVTLPASFRLSQYKLYHLSVCVTWIRLITTHTFECFYLDLTLLRTQDPNTLGRVFDKVTDLQFMANILAQVLTFIILNTRIIFILICWFKCN